MDHLHLTIIWRAPLFCTGHSVLMRAHAPVEYTHRIIFWPQTRQRERYCSPACPFPSITFSHLQFVIKSDFLSSLQIFSAFIVFRACSRTHITVPRAYAPAAVVSHLPYSCCAFASLPSLTTVARAVTTACFATARLPRLASHLVCCSCLLQHLLPIVYHRT